MRFFKSNKPPPPTTEEVSESLNERINGTTQQIENIEKEIQKLKNFVQQNKNRNLTSDVKQKLTILMKRRAMYDRQRETYYAQLFQMDQVQNTNDLIRTNEVTISALKASKKTMEKQTKSIKLHKIEKLKDDVDDLMEDQNELSEILGRNYVLDDFDEDALEAKFDSLINSEPNYSNEYTKPATKAFEVSEPQEFNFEDIIVPNKNANSTEV